MCKGEMRRFRSKPEKVIGHRSVEAKIRALQHTNSSNNVPGELSRVSLHNAITNRSNVLHISNSIGK